MGFNLDNYETVEDRLIRFWADHPNGRIWTVLVAQAGDSVMFRAEIFFDSADHHPKATGYAEEVRGSSPVNKTAHVENCETSAIGRALANCGYATHGKRPSREEMTKAARSHPSGMAPASPKIVAMPGTGKATEKQVNFMLALWRGKGKPDAELEEFIALTVDRDVDVQPHNLTAQEASKVIEALKLGGGD